ncbi:hypothetical protein [Haliangium sp.]|uniref:hypothetical protein n=1 Tax=Haliangium sp. TaxID=2663208 RepID=UPI003D11BC00
MLTLCGAGLGPRPAAAQGGSDGVLVWPRQPGVDVAPAEQALRARGVRVVAFAPLGARLRALGEAAREREAAALARVDAGLEAARAAYLDQRFDDMVAGLEALEEAELAVLADPGHAGALWELCFQLGLALSARAGPGDEARAQARFALALALAPDRRPLRELYGPAVSAAFAAATDARAASAPRPVRVELDPADAVVAIDGTAVVATGAGRVRSLRPGLHVVWAAAPGRRAQGRLITIEDGTSGPRLALPALAEGDALERLAESWHRGTLGPQGTGAQALRELAAGQGASRVVVLAGVEAGVVAQVLSAERVGAAVTGGDAAEAVLAALAGFDRVAGGTPGDDAAASGRPWWGRWWVWAGAGVIAVGATVLGVVATRDDSARWRVYVPPP